MKEKMTMWGIGPKLLISAIPYFWLTAVMTSHYQGLFSLSFLPHSTTNALAVALLSIGTAFFGFTFKSLIANLREGKLMTDGTYSLCRNPIYSSFIIFIVPSLALFINSWLALTTSFLMYAVFKANIQREYDYLKEIFWAGISGLRAK